MPQARVGKVAQRKGRGQQPKGKKVGQARRAKGKPKGKAGRGRRGGRGRGHSGTVTRLSGAPMVQETQGPVRRAFTTMSAFHLPGGSMATPILFHQIITTVTTDASGKVGVAGASPSNVGLPLTTSLLTRIANFTTAWDRIRIRSMAFTYEPAAGTAVDGKLWHYIEYGPQTVATTPQALSLMQGVKEVIPYRKSFIYWKKQDPSDSQFVSSAAGVNFNPVQQQKYFLVGFGLPANKDIGYIHVNAVLEFTGAQ